MESYHYEQFIEKLDNFMMLDENTYPLFIQNREESAVEVGIGKIDNKSFLLLNMKNNEKIATLGAFEGEKICLSFEFAIQHRMPVVFFISSAGVRVQEGTLGLLQMIKISSVVKNHSNEGLFYLSILTNPTLGGVSASFATQADIIIMMEDAIFGFTGQRIIRSSINESLPEDFQTAENNLIHGQIDMICKPESLFPTVRKILLIHS